jgi:hypothetical protein
MVGNTARHEPPLALPPLTAARRTIANAPASYKGAGYFSLTLFYSLRASATRGTRLRVGPATVQFPREGESSR